MFKHLTRLKELLTYPLLTTITLSLNIVVTISLVGQESRRVRRLLTTLPKHVR